MGFPSLAHSRHPLQHGNNHTFLPIVVTCSLVSTNIALTVVHDHDHHHRHYAYSRLLLLPTLLTLLSRGYDTVSGSLALMAAGTMGIAVLDLA